MDQEYQHGIKALEFCLENCKSLRVEKFEIQAILDQRKIGINLECIENENKCLSEEQFKVLAEVFMYFTIGHKIPLLKWLLLPMHYDLMGLLEPSFRLKRHSNEGDVEKVRCIFDEDERIILKKFGTHLFIENGDSISHDECGEMFISAIEQPSCSNGSRPLYLLTLTKSKPTMSNVNNFNVNITGDSNKNINIGNNNTNTITNELPPDFFKQVYSAIESLDSKYKEDLCEFFSKLEDAITSGNKEKGRNMLESIADCIEKLSPFIKVLRGFLGV